MIKRKQEGHRNHKSLNLGGINSVISKNTCLWTSYQNIIWPYGDVKKHSYANLSDSARDLFGFVCIRSSFSESDLLIIGEPLRGMSKESYFSMLRKVVGFIHAPRYIYVPHPSEDSETLEAMEELGLHVFSPEWPIELVLLSNETVPQLIVGSRSSALINLSRMSRFSGQVKTYFRSLYDGKSEKYNALASELESAGVESLF